MPSIAKVVNATLLGVVVSIIFSITEDIKYPIIIHVFLNLSSCASDIFYGLYFEKAPDIEYILKYGENIEVISAIVFILIVLVILSIISYRKRGTMLSTDFKNRLKSI